MTAAQHEVQLEENQRCQHHADDANRRQRIRHVVNPVHAAFEDQCGKEHARELRKLRRLELENGKAHPAPGALDVTREQRDDEGDGDGPEDCPDQRLVPVGAVVDAHGEPEDRRAHDRPQALAHQEIVRVLFLCDRHLRGCAVDHDQAGAHEQQGHDKEHPVRFELSRQIALSHSKDGHLNDRETLCNLHDVSAVARSAKAD